MSIILFKLNVNNKVTQIEDIVISFLSWCSVYSNSVILSSLSLLKENILLPYQLFFLLPLLSYFPLKASYGSLFQLLWSSCPKYVSFFQTVEMSYWLVGSVHLREQATSTKIMCTVKWLSQGKKNIKKNPIGVIFFSLLPL